MIKRIILAIVILAGFNMLPPTPPKPDPSVMWPPGTIQSLWAPELVVDRDYVPPHLWGGPQRHGYMAD